MGAGFCYGTCDSYIDQTPQKFNDDQIPPCRLLGSPTGQGIHTRLFPHCDR
jgi:hypothetical protein